MTEDIKDSLYVDEDGVVLFDDSELMLKWGFDALFSNMGYRLVKVANNEIVLVSKDEQVKDVLIANIPLTLSTGYSRLTSDSRDTDVFRQEIAFAGESYYLDMARSDLLGQLANEAVIPSIVDALLFAVLVSFLLFLTANVVAIRLIVKPVKKLSNHVEKIRTDDLSDRIEMEKVPSELSPIIIAFNDALDRVELGFEEQKRFVADAAHELRTPLAILLSRIELSLKDKDLRASLVNDTQYISRIVEQLLDLSRAQSFGQRKLTKVDLTAVSKSICGLLAPLAIQNKQDLEVCAPKSPCYVQAEEGELSVVIKNLLENAIKHTPEKSRIKITISPEQFSIEDSGAGIPNELKSKVFDRFYRVNQSNRTGSGLGLAIAKEQVAHFNATLKLKTSEELGGAQFLIIFNSK